MTASTTPLQRLAIENRTRVDDAALRRLVARALDGGSAASEAMPAVSHLRFLEGGTAPPPRDATARSLDVWVGSPGPRRAAGDVVLPEARALAPALREDVGPLPAPLRPSLDRFARAVAGRRVGVALSGGGAWCYAHVALLRELDAAGVPVDVIAGSSLGAAIGGLYALRGGRGLDELLAAHRRVHLAAAASVLSSRAIESVTAGLVGAVDLADLGGPLVVVMAGDLDACAALPIRHGPLAAAVRASCGFPGVYGPAWHEGRRVVDGALVDNVPVRALREEGAAVVVAASAFVAPLPRPPSAPQGRVGRCLAALSPAARARDAARAALLFGSRVSARLAEEADAVFAPALSPFELTDWHCAHAIVDRAAPHARAVARALAARLLASAHRPHGAPT